LIKFLYIITHLFIKIGKFLLQFQYNTFLLFPITARLYRLIRFFSLMGKRKKKIKNQFKRSLVTVISIISVFWLGLKTITFDQKNSSVSFSHVNTDKFMSLRIKSTSDSQSLKDLTAYPLTQALFTHYSKWDKSAIKLECS
jgi:hypothetical protein